jgi:hypothetical protein
VSNTGDAALSAFSAKSRCASSSFCAKSNAFSMTSPGFSPSAFGMEGTAG